MRHFIPPAIHAACARFIGSALVAVVAIAGSGERVGAQPLTTAFTYQGELGANGSPAAGLHDFRFRLYDSMLGGAQIGSTICMDNINVALGRFIVQLDFASQFAGQQRFLEIEVRTDTGLNCSNATGFITLTPRQSLTAAPNALFALNAAAATNAVSATTAGTAANATQLNGQAASFYQNAANLSSGTIPSARLTGAYSNALSLTNAGNTFSGAFSGAFSGSGTGLTGLNATSLFTGTLGDARLSSNVALLAATQTFTAAKTFTGGLTTDAFRLSVGGVAGRVLQSNGSGVGTWQPDGVSLPYTDSVNSATHIMDITQTGTGDGAQFNITNAASAGEAVEARTNGTGDAVQGVNTGTGRAALFEISNAGNENHAVYVTTNGTGNAIHGRNTNTSTAFLSGVYGRSDAPGGYGVFGWAPALLGDSWGGRFEADSNSARAVQGVANSTQGNTYGGLFTTYSTGGLGVVGVAIASSGFVYGVYGVANNGANGYAVYANGNSGASGSKSFRIDHPDDPSKKYLIHYSSESPEIINFYSGKAVLDGTGEAVVELPRYFAKINKDPRYTLTPLGSPMPMLHVAEEIDEDLLASAAKATPDEPSPLCTFRIAGGAPGAKVSWRVEAVRNDRWVQKRGAPVEVDKQGSEMNTYQDPSLYGQPPEKEMYYDSETDRSPSARRELPAAAPIASPASSH